MAMKYAYFQKCLTNRYGYNPSERPVDAHSEHEAVRKVKQAATNGDTSTITILFVYEDGERSRARAILGWRKGETGTVRPLPQYDVENYFNEFEAEQKLYRLPQ